MRWRVHSRWLQRRPASPAPTTAMRGIWPVDVERADASTRVAAGPNATPAPAQRGTAEEAAARYGPVEHRPLLELLENRIDGKPACVRQSH